MIYILPLIHYGLRAQIYHQYFDSIFLKELNHFLKEFNHFFEAFDLFSDNFLLELNLLHKRNYFLISIFQ